MKRQTAAVILLEILGGFLLLVLLGLGLLAWRLTEGPLELTALKDDIERALASARDGRAVRLEQVQLEWVPELRRVEVTASGVRWFDRAGAIAAEARSARVDLDASSLFLGRVEVVGIDLMSGHLDIAQLTPDTWSIGGDPLPPIPAGTLPQTPAEWIDAADRVSRALLGRGEDVIANVGLERVTFTDFEIAVQLLTGERLAVLGAATGGVAREEGDLALRVSGDGLGPVDGRVALTLATRGGFTEASLAAGLEETSLAPTLSALSLPVAWAGPGGEAALSVQLGASRDQGLTALSVTASVDTGALGIGALDLSLRQAGLEAGYDPEQDRLDLTLVAGRAGPASGRLQAVVRDVVRESGPRPFSVTAPSLRLDLRPLFPEAWSLSALSVDGRLDWAGRAVELTRLETGVFGARLRGEGTLALAEGAAPGALPFTADLAASVTGPMSPAEVLQFWPVRLGAGARRFVEQRIEQATLTEATAIIALRPDSLAAGHLPDEALDVRFSARDVAVRFLSDVPPVTDGVGTGRLRGNSFRVDVARGRLADWSVSEGVVDFPRLNPKGEDFRVFARGSGPARSLLEVVSNSRLQLEASTGFDPDRVTGQGEMQFEMFRPALDRVAFEDVRFSAEGTVEAGGITDLFLGEDLTESRARVRLEPTALTIEGTGTLGPASVRYLWRDGFDDGDRPSRIRAETTLTPDVLNRFGLLGRAYLSGEVPVSVEALANGADVVKADIGIDLTPARLDIAEIGWLKPAGEAARADVSYRTDTAARRAAIDLDAGTLALSGTAALGPGNRLIALDLERAYLRGRAEVKGQVTRAADEAIAVTLSGDFLDLSGLSPDLGSLGAGSQPTGLSVPLRIDAEVEHLRLGEALDLAGARVAALAEPDGLSRFDAQGDLDGTPLSARLRRLEAGTELSLQAGDAGALLASLVGLEGLSGGEIDLSGTLAPGGGPSTLRLLVTDARLSDAPFLTQILSLASLRGLADTLGGDGILFSEILVPIRIGGGRIVVEGARASGPALGLTANGWFAPETGRLDISGVLVPSFGVNSALGGIPIIGDLMVGREGEGIFSLTYAVEGSLEKAQVSVNPLSAVTPGVLRRIFENPAETDLPLAETE